MPLEPIEKFSGFTPATLPLSGGELVPLLQNGVNVVAPINQIIILASFSKNALPVATPAGQLIYVNDATGGAVPAFSDNFGAWRRVTDRSIVN